MDSDNESSSENGLPKDDDSVGDKDLTPHLPEKSRSNKRIKRETANTMTDDHEYITEHCLVPTESLRTFADVVGAHKAITFAEQYEPVAVGAQRALSGLLLFGSSGTGKTMVAEAICESIGGTFYKFTAAHMPSGKAGAMRIDALFDVAQAGSLPAVIFLDECDTLLSKRSNSTSRVGHFAIRFERFTDNLLVIGATNDPEGIAPKILTGRFERKIFIDNPNASARKKMIQRQLAEEDVEHKMSSEELNNIVAGTEGRSAVNLERLISSAAKHAAGTPVTEENFRDAMEEEPTDFDKKTALKCAKYDRVHGWKPQ